MLITKVLNNNALIAQKAPGQVVLVLGSGVAFQKRAGEAVDATKVEKVLALHDLDAWNRFTELAITVPAAEITAAEKIINFAKLKLGKKLNEIIYVDLTDHLHAAIERHRTGIDIHNSLKWDIARLYPDEYAVGQKALQIVQRDLQVTLIEDEAAFIALHFINAEVDNSQHQNLANQIVKIVKEIEQIVKDYYHTELDDSSLGYYRFITHLKFFAQRCLLKEHYDDEDEDLLKLIQQRYPKAASCAQKIKLYMVNNYNYQINNTEIVYLTVHIHRLVKNLN
ncbi:BglG family transcription antiterminator LicT [Bombilactobacillus mellifer]|uniref:BglG family transcription antiterminator LicT n=1 Tax=Bombilactobacillus mellifer TaxID=1218492 RepID=UPI0023F34BAF|nr:PRD domain-containing protein [Bombilactobacillus mellifer]MCT6826261.1 PRD domain-containing protein [Bombilactobacillus mellifer]MCT6844141.1 PRD domain-containing protein [Bombilactobacillus mellifer]